MDKNSFGKGIGVDLDKIVVIVKSQVFRSYEHNFALFS